MCLDEVSALVPPPPTSHYLKSKAFSSAAIQENPQLSPVIETRRGDRTWVAGMKYSTPEWNIASYVLGFCMGPLCPLCVDKCRTQTLTCVSVCPWWECHSWGSYLMAWTSPTQPGNSEIGICSNKLLRGALQLTCSVPALPDNNPWLNTNFSSHAWMDAGAYPDFIPPVNTVDLPKRIAKNLFLSSGEETSPSHTTLIVEKVKHARF